MNIKTFVNCLIFIAEQVYEKRYLSRRRPAKAQASRLKSGFGAVRSQNVETRQRARELGTLDGCACLFEGSQTGPVAQSVVSTPANGKSRVLSRAVTYQSR